MSANPIAKRTKSESSILIHGKLIFANLFEPGAPRSRPDKLRYGVTIQVAKDSPEMNAFWEAIKATALRVWGQGRAMENLKNAQKAIQAGFDEQASPIQVFDGDIRDPEYNAGFWLIHIRRDQRHGPPAVYGLDRQPVQDVKDAPQPGDGVRVFAECWMMRDYPSINLSLEGVRLMQKGQAIGGPNPAVVEAGIEAMVEDEGPATIPGVVPAGQLEAQAGPRSAPAPQNDVQAAPTPTNSPGMWELDEPDPNEDPAPTGRRGPQLVDLG